jgi:7,8-dihydropterin-6-yl-methyl-4-(beta-D-ribofuranosyl)aminobenzene 5'-phosphate synthase
MRLRPATFLLVLAITAGSGLGAEAQEGTGMGTDAADDGGKTAEVPEDAGNPAGVLESTVMGMEAGPLTITILYDNRAGPEGLASAWGFACLIEGLPSTILFDTGGDSPTLLRNMAKLGVAPETVDAVVLSHAHDDHTGGLAGFLDVRGAAKVYLLGSSPGAVADAARARGAEVIEVAEPTEICAGATLSADLGDPSRISEQCLLLSGDAGVAVVTGCAHPGIVRIVERVKELTGRNVVSVLGGFHLLRTSDEAVDAIISRLRELGVRYVVPCHCTGDGAIERFAVSYGDAFTRCHAGAVIVQGDLLMSPQGRSRRTPKRSGPEEVE